MFYEIFEIQAEYYLWTRLQELLIYLYLFFGEMQDSIIGL